MIASLFPISPAQRFIEGSLSGGALHHGGHRAAGQNDAPPGHQGCVGIVGDNQHQLVALLKQAQRPLLVDARVFNLVNEDDKIDDDHIADIIQGRPTILPQEVRDVIFTKVRSYACDILDKLRELQVDLRANPAIFIGGGSILFRSFVEESPLVAHADFVTDPKANAIGYGMLATAQLRRMAPQNYGGEFFAQG